MMLARGDRVAILGAGHVGATAAYALMLRGLFSEIVLIDPDEALARAEAADISDANAMARPARIWAGNYADTSAASIAVLTAGGVTQGAQSRLSVADDSAAITRSCIDGLLAAKFQGVILVSSNPVDLMTLIALRRSGFPPGRVIGTGALLDTSRLRQSLADTHGVAAGSVEGYVLGEHGDSAVVALSTVRIGGLTLGEVCAGGALPDKDVLTSEIRNAGYEILTGKGYTSFGVATAIVRICEAIVRDERSVLPVSSLVQGVYGLKGICLSLPCVIGGQGVERTLAPRLDDAEDSALHASATTLKAAIAGMSSAD